MKTSKTFSMVLKKCFRKLIKHFKEQFKKKKIKSGLLKSVLIDK